MKRKQLVNIFFGDQRPLPEDILYLILEISGLAKYGRHMSCFQIFFKPSHKWREKKPDGNGSSAHGSST